MTAPSALVPVQRLLPAAPLPIGNGRVAPAGASHAGRLPLRLTAAAQFMTAATARSLAIVAPHRRTLLFVLTVVLFGITVFTEIAYEGEMWVSRTVAGIPQHYIVTAGTLLVVAFSDNKYPLHMLKRPRVIFYLLCLFMVIVVGEVRNRSNPFIVRADLYLIRWFFVGFLLMRLAIISGHLRHYLAAAAIVIVATAMQIDARNTMGGQISSTVSRLSSHDLWPLMNLGTIMLGLLVTVTWPRGILHLAFSSAAFSVLILLGGIRSSTRSLFVFQAFCFLLCLIALSRDPRMQGRGKELRTVGVLIVLFAAVVLGYLVVTGQALTGMTQLGTRFTAETSERYDSGAARIREAADMLTNLAPEEWVFGMGVGGMFFNTLGYWASVPHIAVLGWLQKGGMFIFSVVLWTLYLAPLGSFIKALMSPRPRTPVPTPILIVGPPLIAWAILTFLSGGIDNGTFLGLGGLSALWLQLSDDERRFIAAK